MMQKYLGSSIENKKVDGDCGKAEIVKKLLIIYFNRADSKIYEKVQNVLSFPSGFLEHPVYIYIFLLFLFFSHFSPSLSLSLSLHVLFSRSLQLVFL